VVLDLSRLTFIDSSAIHIILELQKRCARQQVRLVIAPGSRAVQRPFEVLELTRPPCRGDENRGRRAASQTQQDRPAACRLEREMRRLAMSTRLFAVILAAVVTRILMAGLTVTSGIVAAAGALLTSRIAAPDALRPPARAVRSRSTSTDRRRLRG
jgi:hypothetical protein